MLCINGKTKKNYIHTLFRIIFKRNRIESQKTKLYIFYNCTYSNRIILNIIIKMYHYNRIKHRVLYGIELHKLRCLNTIESKLYQS